MKMPQQFIACILITMGVCGCTTTKSLNTPKIDGILSDAVWEAIAPRPLLQPQDRVDTGRVISEQGSVRFFHEDGILYLAAEFDDSFLIAAGEEDGDDLYHGDCFELFLKPAGHFFYWEIWISPASLRSVSIWRKRGELGSTGRTLEGREIDLSVITQGTLNGMADDAGWTLEAAIPLPDGPGSETGAWEILLARQNYDGSLSKDTRELSSFPQLLKSSFHRTEEYFPIQMN